jgi:hypothetical protein
MLLFTFNKYAYIYLHLYLNMYVYNYIYIDIHPQTTDFPTETERISTTNPCQGCTAVTHHLGRGGTCTS